MKNVIITGGTGMIGGIILNTCLSSDDIGKVTMINRTSAGIAHEKLSEIIHSDFTDLSSIESHFQNQDIAYYCLGVYTGAVDRETFRTITVDYTKSFARTLKDQSPNVSFCFLSGMGADQTEKSRMMFAKDKGSAENHLISLHFKQLNIFRPGYIYPVTPRIEPNLSYKIMRFLYPIYKRAYPNGVIASTELANAIFISGVRESKMTIFENKNIKEIADNLAI
jgi:uncharacterized protein YbjT (DUF2867 family)